LTDGSAILETDKGSERVDLALTPTADLANSLMLKLWAAHNGQGKATEAPKANSSGGVSPALRSGCFCTYAEDTLICCCYVANIMWCDDGG
jgi:hypothetical protein